MGQQLASIELSGVFRLRATTGEEIPLPGRRAAALLALLATSRNFERSRDFVKATLWPRSPDAQASSSLRTLIHTLRKALGPYAEIFVAGRTRVGLRRVEIIEEVDPRHEFFEDAPCLGEDFEDWLTEERARLRCAEPPRSAPGCAVRDGRVRVVLQPPEVSEAEAAAGAVSLRLAERLIDGLRRTDRVDVIDETLRSVVSGNPGHVAVKFILSKFAQTTEMGVRVFDPATGTIFWNGALEADECDQLMRKRIDAFARRVVDAIRELLGRNHESAAHASSTLPFHAISV